MLSSQRVTVGMAVFNGSAWVSEAITSVLRQTFRDWTLHIVDDASTDDSVKKIREFNDPRIRLETNLQNQGLPTVRNQILQTADTPFLAWLDQDDTSHPVRLQEQLRLLLLNPAVAASGSWALSIDAPSGKGGRRILRKPLESSRVASELLFSNPLIFSSVMMRLEYFSQANLLFRQGSRNVLDYEMWSEIETFAPIRNSSALHVQLRTHPNQTSRQLAAAAEMRNDAVDVVERMLEKRLGFIWNSSQRELHSRIKLNDPHLLPEHAERITEWLKQLRSLNEGAAVFSPDALDRSLSRQVLRLISGNRTLSYSSKLEQAAQIANGVFGSFSPMAKEILAEARYVVLAGARKARTSASF